MATETTPAFIATVSSDRTIILPDTMPIGATVAVVVIPPPQAEHDLARRERFAATLAAIRDASAQLAPADHLGDADLDALIERARKVPRT